MTKAILFDFDGTLADTSDGIVATMAATLREMGRPAPEADAIRATIGLPLHVALQRVGQLTDHEAEKATHIYKELFPIYEALLVHIFPGVADTLAALRERGLRLAVCTSRDLSSLRLIMDKHGLTPYFELLATADDHLTPKPAPDMVRYLLSEMHLQPEEAWVVGDTTFDIDMGNGAGCRTVAVTYGNHSACQLQESHPTLVIDDFSSLSALD